MGIVPAVWHNVQSYCVLMLQALWLLSGAVCSLVQVIYYRGKNDAWDGYGGATVYTKARQLPQVRRRTVWR